jgi:integrase
MHEFILPTAQKFLDGIAAEKTLSTSSFQKIKWLMVSIFNVARILGAYDHTSINPFADVELPKNRRPKQDGRYATLDQVVLMLQALKKKDVVATRVVALAAFSGLRKSEIQGLRWSDIEGGQIHVQRVAWRTTVIEETTKTEASQSTVPILKVLRKHLTAQKNASVADGYIFDGEKMGRPLDLHNLANRVTGFAAATAARDSFESRSCRSEKLVACSNIRACHHPRTAIFSSPSNGSYNSE